MMYSSKDLCYNDTSCDCFFITDIRGDSTTCEYDSRFSNLIGCDSLTDPSVRDLTNIIYSEDLARFRKVRNSVSSVSPFESLNLRLVRKDRTLIFVRCNLIYTTTEDNYERIIYAFSVLGDSELFRQQDELIREMQPLIFKFRSGEQFPYFYNDSFLRVIGYTREEAEKLSPVYTDFMNSCDVDHFVHAIRCAEKSGTICGCTVRVNGINNTTSWISCSFKKMAGPSGEEYFIGFGNDITEHKKTEYDLMKNRMLLKNITENLSCATLVLNSAETNAELIRANKGFMTLFGYSEEDTEKYRKNISELIIHPNDHSDFIHGIMRTGYGQNNICRAITGDGRTIWVSFASFGSFEDDKPCYVCTFHDVTVIQEMKNELDAVRGALASEAAKCDDVYCVIDFNERTLTIPDIFSQKYNLPEIIENMPEGLFRYGTVQDSFREAVTSLYFDIKNGSHHGSCNLKLDRPETGPLWVKADVTAVDGRDCCSSKAIVILSDVSREVRSDNEVEAFSAPASEGEIFSCILNLSKSRILNFRSISGLNVPLSKDSFCDPVLISSLVSRTHPEDRSSVMHSIDLKTLWKNYFDGCRNSELIFRIRDRSGRYMAVKALISYYNDEMTEDVILSFTVIENEENPECRSITESDYSGAVRPQFLVSKDVFRALVNDYLESHSSTEKFHALYVLDINGFMELSKKLGSKTGQKILNAVSESVLSLKLSGTAGKMYGDEFLVFVRDIPSYDEINLTAKHISTLCQNISVPELKDGTVTGCAGVSYFPVHGNDFDTLYRKAESALRSAKRFDRSSYAIYTDEFTADRRQLKVSDFKEKASEIVKTQGITFHLYNADIRHFRNINHIKGYEKGDAILLEICSMLQEFLKPGEYFTRLFADNFLLLTLVHDTDAVLRRMDEINYRLQKLNIAEAGEIMFSAGYVVIDDSNRNAEFEQLLDCAIIAHEKAKEEKRTAFIQFRPGMGDEEFHEYEILSEISDAVKNGQICTFVQPQYDILNREYVSMEALVRWKHPVRGLLTPDSFIGVCEANGFISSIDFCVLEQMCAFIRQRLDMKLRVLPVAVNQSQITIHEKGYVKRLTALVEKYNVPPEYIELEVTESAYVKNLNETISVLSQLRQYGFRISMDDFGSGYSTLNFLKDIPVDALKIDKAFLTRTLMEKKPAEIIKSITSMAHNINIKVVCEGVEHEQQVQFLENIGCELAQGYLFGKPMPYSEVSEFIDNSGSVVSL